MRACRRRGGKPKHQYTQAEAEAKAGPGQNAYECRGCEAWHVGQGLAHGRPAAEAKLRRRQQRKANRKGAWA